MPKKLSCRLWIKFLVAYLGLKKAFHIHFKISRAARLECKKSSLNCCWLEEFPYVSRLTIHWLTAIRAYRWYHRYTWPLHIRPIRHHRHTKVLQLQRSTLFWQAYNFRMETHIESQDCIVCTTYYAVVHRQRYVKGHNLKRSKIKLKNGKST